MKSRIPFIQNDELNNTNLDFPNITIPKQMKDINWYMRNPCTHRDCFSQTP